MPYTKWAQITPAVEQHTAVFSPSSVSIMYPQVPIKTPAIDALREVG
jgi:hypothetical protein